MTYIVQLRNFFLTFDISLVVGKHKETIVIHKNIDYILEQIWIVGTEESVIDLINHCSQFWIGVVIVPCVVTSASQFVDFRFVHAKNENVLQAHFFGHLHVGPIKSANSECSVQL